MIKSKLKNRNLSQEDAFNLSELFKLMKPRVMPFGYLYMCSWFVNGPKYYPNKGCKNLELF
ncbi:MAG: hypothetical protein CM1200mP13_13700 [Candidatus Pelagibacterales bacterium]|nr:MAG: hypothetical protein CM1200mP13_13700 [Pelagibacterales bacterium]